MSHGNLSDVVRRQPALSALVVVLLSATGAAAQPIVLSGYTTTFTKPNGGDPTLPENQDPITSNVAITRGTSGGGVYNALAESGFPARDPDAISPKFTAWATIENNSGETIEATNWPTLTFGTWLNAYGGLGQVAHKIEGLDAVLRIDREEIGLEDVYLDIRFTSWSSGFGAGGFSYERATTPTGDYNRDGVVDAADYVVWRKTLSESVAPGAGADGNLNRSIDDGDYAFWRSRFGNDVSPGSGAGTIVGVPEPTATLLALAGFAAAPLASARRR